MTSIGQLLKDLFCGCASGWGQVLSMMPFQNIKVKVVSRPDQYKGYLSALTKTIKEQGFLSFYRGMLMPLIGVGAQVAVQFGFVESLKKIMKNRYADQDGKLHWKYSFLSGSLCGLPSAIVVTVLDHSRFRVLLNRDANGEGSVKTAVNIYKKYGLRKLYLGFGPTWLRESALGIYFGIYDAAFTYYKKSNSESNSSLLAGGLAGVATWSAMYPVDYVKTIMQSDSLEKPQYKNSMEILRTQVAKGIHTMYRGFGIMIVRAYIVNAFGFYCFENAKKLVY